jgi:RimJ/RimL family protein N-acetyltransferase
MQILRTFDPELIKAIITHPKVYPHCIDDSSPPPDEFEPYVVEQLYNLIAWDDEPAGAFMFVPVNLITYEMHLAMLPEFWGRGREALGLAIDWMFSHSPCKKIIGGVPAFNRLTVRLLEDMGFEQEGISPKSFQKQGIIYDRLMLGISKE